MVKDNGKGMEEGQAEYFNHFDYKKERVESSIGVRNVITRIEALLWGAGKLPCGIKPGGDCYNHSDSL